MKWTAEKLVARWNEIGQEMNHIDLNTPAGNARGRVLIEEMNEIVKARDALTEAEQQEKSGTMTLQDELAAEFEKHDFDSGLLGLSCTCGWHNRKNGQTAAQHLAEIATRITNARVEGLIREAAEAGFKMRKTYGEPEYGVVYPVYKGEEPTRIVGLCDKYEAEGFLSFWRQQDEKALMVTRQWRAMG